MRFTLVLLIFCLISYSLCAHFERFESPSDAVVEGREDESYERGTKERMQDMTDDEDSDDSENGDNHDLSNQDDGDDANGDTTQPNTMDQPNTLDQNRGHGMPGVPERAPESLPQPDYSSVNMRGYAPQCHSGQYQCQKTDPSAPTRCIPQEWRCNGLRDCENNDDESGCSTDQLTRGRPQIKCTAEQYQCHGSGINSVPPQCIERRFICDGTYHCSYGDDEANCADRRQPTPYPHSRAPQRSDISTQTSDPSIGRADPRDIYRPQQSTGDRKSEEYVQRLEWRDRCFRSCLKY